MCRAPLGRLVEEDSDFDIDELNWGMAEAAFYCSSNVIQRG